MAAYDRFYKGDIAEELVRGRPASRAGSSPPDDLADWQARLEEPVNTSYKGIDVYKLTVWTQGPAMLQALNILENADLRSMGYNSPRYIHTVYQAMSMAFADRDFYYGDPAVPARGAGCRAALEGLRPEAAGGPAPRPQRSRRAPRRPHPFQGGTNPFKALLEAWRTLPGKDTGLPAQDRVGSAPRSDPATEVGTTSVIAADAEGWVVSMTPSGAWNRRSSPATAASASANACRRSWSRRPTTPTTWSPPASSRA